MIEANRARTFRFIALARLALLVFWYVGIIATCRWSGNVFGTCAKFSSVTLFCFTPEIIGWTTTICPDSSAGSMGLLSLYTFRRWLIDQSWPNVVLAGVGLGLTLLTKTSWIFLIVLYPILALTHQKFRTWHSVTHLLLIILITVATVNLGYCFDRSFQRLGDFQFFSQFLAGPNQTGTIRQRISEESGNRFRENWIGDVWVPLPASFVEGLDLQKYDFEEGKWSYLRGEHKFGGWWYWYLYALMVKTPVGTILLFFIACGWAVWKVEWRRLFRRRAMRPSANTKEVPSYGLTATFSPEFGGEGTRTESQKRTVESRERNEQRPLVLHENLILLAPAVCLFVLVSSQTGFSRYLRYVLPCYPFVFIWMSQIFSEKAGLPAWLRKVCWGLLAWSVISSLSVFPHSMSYFNELAGGPENGPAHLIDASIDWGQDVLFLADWVRRHPEAKPLYLSLHVFFDPRIAGIDYEHPPVDPRYSNQREYLTSDQVGPKPGWYSISVHQLYSRNKEFAYLFDFPKADMVGYSIYIYHLTQQDVDDWNRKHGFE